MRTMLLAAAGVLVLSACPAEEPAQGPPEGPLQEPTPTPADEPVPLTQECTSPDGFTISYPEGWVTDEECTLFDPESVEFEGMHVPESIGVYANVDAVEFERTEPERFEEELGGRETTIDGRPALRLETEATGEGLYDAGHVSTSWRVDLDGETFIAITHDVEELDYAANQAILDAMVESLTFDV